MVSMPHSLRNDALFMLHETKRYVQDDLPQVVTDAKFRSKMAFDDAIKFIGKAGSLPSKTIRVLTDFGAGPRPLFKAGKQISSGLSSLCIFSGFFALRDLIDNTSKVAVRVIFNKKTDIKERFDGEVRDSLFSAVDNVSTVVSSVEPVFSLLSPAYPVLKLTPGVGIALNVTGAALNLPGVYTGTRDSLSMRTLFHKMGTATSSGNALTFLTSKKKGQIKRIGVPATYVEAAKNLSKRAEKASIEEKAAVETDQKVLVGHVRSYLVRKGFSKNVSVISSITGIALCAMAIAAPIVGGPVGIGIGVAAGVMGLALAVVAVANIIFKASAFKEADVSRFLPNDAEKQAAEAEKKTV